MHTGVSTEVRDDVVIITASGEIDMDTAPDLRAAMQPHLGFAAHLIADLTAVTFMDSSGLSVFVGAAQELGEGRLTVVAANERVLKVFRLTGLDQVIPIVADLPTALAR